MKAVPIVSSLPCATYTKNDVIENKIGGHVQMREKRTELIRATRPKRHFSHRHSVNLTLNQNSTLDHPLHLDLTGVEHALDPAILPCEELDKLDRTDQLVQHAHAFVPSSRDSLLDADGVLCNKVIERPDENQYEEACEGRPA